MLLKPFVSKGSGGIRSKYITREFRRLLEERQVRDQLLIHSDRGSEFTSLEYRSLFEKNPLLIGSMSCANTPYPKGVPLLRRERDNAVAERWVRTVKNQVPEAGAWPLSFKTMGEASAFLEKRRTYLNKSHVTRTGMGLSAVDLYQALESNKDLAPSVIAHWAEQKGLLDTQTRDITLFKVESTRNWTQQEQDWSPLSSLRNAETFSKLSAQGIERVEGGQNKLFYRIEEMGQELGQELREGFAALSKQLLEKKKPSPDPRGVTLCKRE